MYTLNMYTLNATPPPTHTAYVWLCMTVINLFICDHGADPEESPISSACLYFLLPSFVVIVVVIYLWEEGSPLCCPTSATTIMGSYHVLLQSMWVMLEKVKEGKKGR